MTRACLTVAILLCAWTASADPVTIYVTVPPLKTETQKAALELQRQFARRPKDVTVVESPEAAAYTVEILSVGTKVTGASRSVVPGRVDTREAVVIESKVCIVASAQCDTVTADSGSVLFGQFSTAASYLSAAIRKAIK
jgi:hypothetical protein